MNHEEQIIALAKAATKSSAYSTRKQNLDLKKLVNSLLKTFIFLSLDGESLSKSKVVVKIQDLATDNILDEGGYMDEFLINNEMFARDLCNSFKLEKQ